MGDYGATVCMSYMIQIGRVIGATSGYIENTQSNAHFMPFQRGVSKLSAYQSLFRNKSPQPVLTSSVIRMQRSLFILLLVPMVIMS